MRCVLAGAARPLGHTTSGIAKQPVTGPCHVGPLGLAGDEQADLKAHGGEYKAVHCYAWSHYAYWRSVLPGGFHELQYETLVASQEDTTRALLDACGLDFDPACLAFHENPAAVATASAAQVREPLHARSVGASRHYAAELAPLRAALIAEGVSVQ